MSAEKTAILFILGMHRSGTSCLAGSLERCGLYFGNVDRAGVATVVESSVRALPNVDRVSAFNPKGHYELPDLNLLLDAILAANGGSWCETPPALEVTPEQRQAMAAVLGAFPSHLLCGIKDPRALLFMPILMELANPCGMVGTYRHPAAVALSLLKRNQMPAEQAHQFWNRYNSELVSLHQKFQFPLVEFNLAAAPVYIESVAAVALRLGLAPAESAIGEFVSTELDHAAARGSPVPPVCRELYEYLCAHRYQPSPFDGQVLQLYRELRPGATAAAERRAAALQQTINTLHQQVADLQKQNARQQSDLVDKNQIIEHQRLTIDGCRQTVARLQAHPLYQAYRAVKSLWPGRRRPLTTKDGPTPTDKGDSHV